MAKILLCNKNMAKTWLKYYYVKITGIFKLLFG